MPDSPDATVIEAAPPSAPTQAAPTPSQPAASTPGIERFMADVMKGVDESPVKAAAKPETKPAAESKPAPAKPEAKVETKPGEKTPDKGAVKPPELKVESSADLRKRLAEVEKSDKARLTEIETLRKQNEDYQKRRFITPEIEKEIEDNKQEMAFLKRQIAESHYERSADFKRDYADPFNNAFKDAINTALEYPITNNEDGTTRAATKADFQKVAGAPVSERAAIARQLFGDNALSVLSDARELDRLRSKANEAIRAHSEKSDSSAKELQRRQDEDQKAYDGFRNLRRQELAEKYPEVFGESPDDPELTEAWKSGTEFVDRLASTAQDMPLEERAAYVEVIRARAAAFPRMHKENSKLKSKVTELEVELAKFRACDPGEAAEKGAIQKGGEVKPLGLNSMVDVFRDMDQ